MRILYDLSQWFTDVSITAVILLKLGGEVGGLGAVLGSF